GTCGNICPTPTNALAVCELGACGRSACAVGFFDVDGATTFGCETQCSGNTCQLPGGQQVRVTNPPVPESGGLWRTLATGGSFGAHLQTSAGFTNLTTVGEPTPAVRGSQSQSSASYRNLAGFSAAVK